MLQYLVILLDDTSTSFCHYKNKITKRRLIPLDVLERGIRFGMMENQMIQFVFPAYELPQEYMEMIEKIDHSKIKPQKKDADVWVVDNITSIDSDIPVVYCVEKEFLFINKRKISKLLGRVPRLNIVLTDLETFTENDYAEYTSLLEILSSELEQLYEVGKKPQLNLLTDRIMLKQMNNCGAGDTTITLAPNGKFYVCPAFYYDDENDNIGDLEHGLNIKNKQLFKLSFAPICSHCDAWQCKRCIWMNRKTTLEVNTPSHEQCVLAHLERNASRKLQMIIRKYDLSLNEQSDIPEIDYLDPFEKRKQW